MGRFRILKQLICIIFLSLAPLMQNHRNPLCNSTRGYSAACTAILFFFFFLHLLSAYQWLQVYSAAAASVVMYARRYYTGKTARS